MKCCRCHTEMLITEKKGIEIDYCPICYGIWLDKGELKKIMELIAEYYSDKQNYQSDYENYNYGDPDFIIRHPNRRKKSFVNQIFDLE